MPERRPLTHPTTSAPGPPRPTSAGADAVAGARIRDHGVAFAGLIVATFVVGLDNSVMNVALPSVARDLDAGASTLEWVAGAYSLLFGGLLLTGGTVADRLGHRRVLLAGLGAFGALSLLALAVQDSLQLIVLRAALGAAAAFLMPGTLALVFRTFRGPARTTAVGVWGAVASLGFAIGPMIGGTVVEHVSWRATLAVNVPFVLVAIALVVAGVPGGEVRRRGRVDVLGTVLSVAALGSLVAGLIESAESGWTSGLVLGLLAAAVVAGAAFVVWERRSSAPMVDIGLLGRPGVAGATAVQATVMFGIAGVLFLVTQQLQIVAGHSPFHAGLRTLPLAAGAVLAAPFTDRVIGGLGIPRAAAAGLLAAAAGLATIGVGTPHGYGWLAAGGALFAAGLVTTIGPLSMVVIDGLPEDQEGLGSALNDTAQEVGSALGIAIIGSVFTAAFRRGVPTGVPDELRGSVHAVLALPDPTVVSAGRAAFAHGMELATIVAAGIVLVAVAALRTLPDVGRRGSATEPRFDQEPLSTT